MSPKYPINLLRGWPAPSLLPTAALKRAADRVLSNPAVAVPALSYGPDLGYQPLREELARWLGRFYGTTGSAAPDAARICITGGASQSMACILQSYTDPIATRAIWIAAPCYFLACPIFEDSGFGQRMRAVPEDDRGLDLDHLERSIKAIDKEEAGVDKKPLKQPEHRKVYRHVIYVVPSCGNPSGTSMPVSRREALVRLARRHDALVISDDVYDLLQWPASGAHWASTSPHRPSEMRLPRLSDIDRDLGREGPGRDDEKFGNTVSNGSFSKLVGPGIRTGWVDAMPAFAYGLSRTGSSRSGGAPSQLAAAIVHEMLVEGELDHHIETVTRPQLQRRHRLIEDAIKAHLLPLGVTVRSENLTGSANYGGYFVWLTLPIGVNAQDVAAAAKEENLVIGSGSIFEVRGDEKAAAFPDKVRLSFAWEDEEALIEGVKRLADAIKIMPRGSSQA